MKTHHIAILLTGTLSAATLLLAQDYSIDWWKVAGGGGTSTGGVYSVSGTFGPLTPRQQITAAPFAIFAGGVASGGLATSWSPDAVVLSNAANRFHGSFSGDGRGMTNVDAATLGVIAGGADTRAPGSYAAVGGGWLNLAANWHSVASAGGGGNPSAFGPWTNIGQVPHNQEFPDFPKQKA